MTGHLSRSSLPEIARPLSQLSSSPINSRRVFSLPPSPTLESQQASVWREQGTVMVIARQPAASSPACCLLSWSPAEAWPSAMPLACITAFLSQGLDKKGSVLPMRTLKRKWEAAGTRKDPRKAASYRRNEDLESEPLDSGPSYPPPAPRPPLPPRSSPSSFSSHHS